MYRGQSIEILGTKEIFGRKTAWIRFLEDGRFDQVAYEELETETSDFSLAYVRYIAIASKIKDEMAKKSILAPYESSLLPLPHQILVLEKVMHSPHNRFLLADEVGMGKTIETGLILKELKLRGDITRVLCIVPKSSMLQWQSELKEHFNEVFHLYDSEMITSLARTFSNINADRELNFWEQYNQIIVSTDALKPLEKRQGWSQERVDEYNKYRLGAVLKADFDLVIIDEAHKMGGASQQVSRYQLAQALCNTVANVLLLSATPHRGKSDHFRRILQLLDPDAFAGEGLPDLAELEPYVIRTEKRLAVDYEGTKLFNDRDTIRLDVALDKEKHKQQKALYEAVTEYVRKGFNTAKRSGNTATGLIMILFQKLASSSSKAILSAMEGRLQRLQANSDDDPEAYTSDFDEHLEYNSDFNLQEIYYSEDEELVNEEALLSQLVEQAKKCLKQERDAKAEILLQRYKMLQKETGLQDLKIIVFTEFRSTQRMLLEILEKEGYRCAMINGSLDLDQRKIALGKFKNHAQILIATDAAGESLNMQFCHIIFNYDLPWNPMMIEQRIGRVDRIGQKNKVRAYNLLTDNSVDRRVYEVIEEKLNNIFDQLGIDKTSDVLDSALDMKKVNNLYLQSLLDPSRFEFAGDKWLHEIKSKLKEFQSTEGILPQVEEKDIDPKKAAEVKYSPLPTWLEDLIAQYVKVHNGKISQSLLGHQEVSLDGLSKRISFDPEVSMDDPTIEHVTLQHDWVRKILADVGEFPAEQGYPIIKSKAGDEMAGFWSLWQVSAKNAFEEKYSHHSFFIAEDKKVYTAYGNDIWRRLVSGNAEFTFEGQLSARDVSEIDDLVQSQLLITFQNLEAEVQQFLEKKKINKQSAYQFQMSRLEKIGIENIRESKLKKLEKEHERWLSDFKSGSKIIPGAKHLLTVRING